MSTESESLILQLLREMSGDLGNLRTEVGDIRAEVGDIRADMRSLAADFASDLIVTRKEIGEQIVGLQRAVMEYHTSVIGHGILISELEARVRRVEQHLNLPSMEH